MNKIAFIFPGQGSQYVGMSKKICDMFPVAGKTFEEANDVLGFNLQKLCFEGGIEELTKTENTQPAILTASVAAFRVFMQEIGILPEYMAGHSLGEFSALCCSGALEFHNAVGIVRQRGRFMQEAVAIGVGSMAAISGIEQSEIEEQCRAFSSEGQIVVISNYNSPDQIVISGHQQAVASAGAKLKEMGARVIPLKVSAPFHSPLMKPAADRLKEELEKYAYKDFKWPVISNVTAQPYPGKEKIIEYLTAQIVQPVKWQYSMEFLWKQGINFVVEMGPQTVLKNLMKKNVPDIKALSYDAETDMDTVKLQLSPQGQLAGETVGKGTKLVTKCIAIAVCTKNRNWDNDEYQKGVIEPYRKIVSIKEELEKSGVEATVGQMKEALELLGKIFDTKKTPVDEQLERFNEIFEGTGTKGLLEDFKIPAI